MATGTTTTTDTAPSWQTPYQNYGLNQAYANYLNGPQIAPFSPQQEQAISGITNLATNGTQAGNAANKYVSGILGNGPTQNPYLDATFNQAALATQNQLASEFAGAGRNVDQSAGLRGQQLNQLATQIYGGAYNTGVQQQEQAASLAPTLDQNAYAAQGQLFNAGQQVQNLAQNYASAPTTFLNNYLSQVNGSLGQTVTQPYFQNTGAGALGAALVGSQLGSNVSGGSGWGTVIGGVAGGILGGWG